MKLVHVIGARPHFVKVDPVLRAIERHNREHPERQIADILVHTGQHYDYEMSKVFFEQLQLREPEHHLGVGSASHGQQTGEMLKAVEHVLLAERPDVVVVYGDTNSTLAGALAAAKLHVPVAHVEAGLRSFNRLMPEEINRVVADHLSQLLFCPTPTAVDNLRREGITRGVHLVGDVMYDALRAHLAVAEVRSTVLQDLALGPNAYALATIHRAENTDDVERLGGILDALRTIADDGTAVILPLHPRTRKQLQHAKLDVGGVRVIDPQPYLEMLVLEKHAKVILTDSGGVQKEAFLLAVPCVTLRSETEWVETVNLGWNVLAGFVPEQIVNAYRTMRGARLSRFGNPFGAGNASSTIVRILAEEMN